MSPYNSFSSRFVEARYTINGNHVGIYLKVGRKESLPKTGFFFTMRFTENSVIKVEVPIFFPTPICFQIIFLDASSHLYMRVCPSVRPYVCMYVR